MLTIVNTKIKKQSYHILKKEDNILTNRLEIIGKNIRDLRKRQNLSQIDLAVTVGIDRAYLSEIENGKTNITINTLYAIADALNTPITDILSQS